MNKELTLENERLRDKITRLKAKLEDLEQNKMSMTVILDNLKNLRPMKEGIERITEVM
jgi:hypothetical protein